jgi:predicted Zn-dependent protease
MQMVLLPSNLKTSAIARSAAVAVLGFVLVGGVAARSFADHRSFRDRADPRSYPREERGEAARLRQVIVPLVQAMDRPCPPGEVRVEVLNQTEINAANAGSCRFLVTHGLLERANDDQLRGVMAHEIAHQDLGHIAKAQAIVAGLNIGVALLEQLIPGSAPLSSIAGALVARGHSRSEELAADRHALDILRRAGYPPQIMIDTLGWIRRVSGNGGGGFLSTHPALDERIAALRRMR